jgi:hypothetical protein
MIIRESSDLIPQNTSVSIGVLRILSMKTTWKTLCIGYMNIFAGAMTGIRNPKAHENQIISKDMAIKRLIFASLLMDKIDEAISYSNIEE